MRIDDKDELKRFIRAAVRTVQLPDVLTRLNIAAPRMGPDEMLFEIAPGETPEAAFSRVFVERTPLRQIEQDALVALDRLDMPQGDRQVALLRAQAMSPCAYLMAVREQAGWGTALTPVTPETYSGERAASFLEPTLWLDACKASPGRYGGRFMALAERLRTFVRAQGISYAALTGVDERLLAGDWMGCLALPLCEDERLILCLEISDASAVPLLEERLTEFSSLRAAAWCRDAADEPALICAAEKIGRLLPCVRPASIPLALESERPRFITHPSLVTVADLGIGYFRRLRAEMARTLYERYLPLLRSGFALTDHAVTQDVLRMTAGAWQALHDEY